MPRGLSPSLRSQELTTGASDTNDTTGASDLNDRYWSCLPQVNGVIIATQ